MLSLRSPAGGRRIPTELEKAKAEAERAKADSAAAQARADQARAKLEKSTRDSKVRLRLTAVVMMLAALLKLGWQAANDPAPATKPGIAQALTPTQNAMPVSSTEATVTQAEVALDRLRDAFHSFPEEDQPDVVREVNEKYAGSDSTCPLAWARGMPALSLKDGGRWEPMMAAALNHCADGVERLRKERDDALDRQFK